MGLRRAFAQAGVRALVMSLWAIPDRETRDLMEVFYRQVVQKPQGDKAAALRAAQLELIARQRDRREPVDPRTWGAFIVSGR